MVYSAFCLPRAAKAGGAKLALVSMGPTRADSLADFKAEVLAICKAFLLDIMTLWASVLWRSERTGLRYMFSIDVLLRVFQLACNGNWKACEKIAWLFTKQQHLAWSEATDSNFSYPTRSNWTIKWAYQILFVNSGAPGCSMLFKCPEDQNSGQINLLLHHVHTITRYQVQTMKSFTTDKVISLKDTQST